MNENESLIQLNLYPLIHAFEPIFNFLKHLTYQTIPIIWLICIEIENITKLERIALRRIYLQIH